MNDIIEKLKKLYPKYQEKENDNNIVENIIDGIYDENDFFHACKMLFKTTKFKSISPFKNRETFIKFRNLNRELFPVWMDNLSENDKYNLKENYKIIVVYCFKDCDQYNCNYPEILELIYAYHKEGIPYWCISSYIKESLDIYSNVIKKETLIELMNQKNKFIEGCRKIFKKHIEFKKILKEKNINFIESVGVK